MNRSQYSSIYGERRGFPWRFTILLSVLVACLVVCVYQFKRLQSLNLNDEALLAEMEIAEDVKQNNKTMIVLIANYRDSKRCAETVHSIFSNAVNPDLITIGIHDQLNSSEYTCLSTYCKNVPDCRKSQIRSTMIDAAEAKGPTVARYMTEELIADEDFCVSIDSHLIFVDKWDEKILSQWYSLENEYAIISAYPKSTDAMNEKEINHMCYAHIESSVPDAMIEYGPLITEKAGPKPRLCSQLAGGFSFGNCDQAKYIRNDPYTPYLFHGEEYSRATRLWTHGYDLYCPNEDVVYHWYEKRNYIWDEDWGKKWFIQQRSQRRIRKMMGLSISVDDVDLTNIDKFSLGTKRTFEQWKEFTGIDPAAPFRTEKGKQFSACRDLQYVPYNK